MDFVINYVPSNGLEIACRRSVSTVKSFEILLKHNEYAFNSEFFCLELKDFYSINKKYITSIVVSTEVRLFTSFTKIDKVFSIYQE